MFSKSNACPISGFSASRGTRTATSPLITFLRAKTMPQSAIFPVPRRSRPGFRWCRVPARGNDEPLPPGTLVLTASGGDGEGVPPQAAARTVQILFKALERTGADHPGSVLDGLPRRDGGQNRRRRRAGVGVDVAYPKPVYFMVSSNLPPNPLDSQYSQCPNHYTHPACLDVADFGKLMGQPGSTCASRRRRRLHRLPRAFCRTRRSRSCRGEWRA